LQGSPAMIGHLSLTGWVAILFLGLLCSGVAYIFWYDALKIAPASRVGAMLYLEPLIAAGVAALILGEPILVTAIGGGAMILLGVWMVNRREMDEEKIGLSQDVQESS
jgi:drug/metabolite transporter (DMT)-like permease